MDGWLQYPDGMFLDETARFLDELEAEREDYFLLGAEGPDFGFRNPYYVPGTWPHFHASPYDHLLDDTALLLDAAEAYQESLTPSVEPFGPVSAEPHEPEVQIYGWYGTQPPTMPEPDLWEPPSRRAPRRFIPRQVGGSAGVRTADTGESSSHEDDGRVKLWCVRRGELVSEPDDECASCDEDCPFVEGEAQEGAE